MAEAFEQARARKQAERHKTKIGARRARFIREVRVILARHDLDGFQKEIRIRGALSELDGQAR